MAKKTAEDWALAALYALADGGERAVAVERIAKTLGVTKGSFYWHFPNRGALLEAALTLWEMRGTAAITAALDALPSPHERLRQLLVVAIDELPQLRVEAALGAAATAGHPVIGPVYERVCRARMAYLEEQFAALGYDQPGVEATAMFAAYLGVVQLAALRPSPLAEEDLPTLGSMLADRLVPTRPTP